jgi:hypothetical protein
MEGTLKSQDNRRLRAPPLNWGNVGNTLVSVRKYRMPALRTQERCPGHVRAEAPVKRVRTISSRVLAE